MALLFWLSQSGIISPRVMETPKMKRFLVEFMSTCCRLDTPTDAIIPSTNKSTVSYNAYYTENQKIRHKFFCHNFIKFCYHTPYEIGNKALINIPPRLKRVAALPCEILTSETSL